MIKGLKPYPEYKESRVSWLGRVPEHWSIKKVREVAKIVNGFPFDSKLFSPTTGHPLIRIRDLNQANTAIRYDGPLVREVVVEPGELLIAMDGDFNVGTWRGREPALLNQRVCCVRGINPLVTRFLRYVLPLPLKEINDITWATTVKHLSSRQVERITIGIPPDSELREIVSFLDQMESRMTRLIRVKRKLISLLNEQRQVLIDRIVTRGLDPLVALRSSGAKWLGEVPEHWQVLRARYLFREVNTRSQAGIETHLSMSQQLGLVPSSMVASSLRSESYAGGKLCQVNDLVLNRLKAHLGVFAVAQEPGVVSPDYTVLRAIRPLEIKYFEYVLRSPSCRYELRQRAKGIVEGFWRLYTEDFYDIKLPVPPLAEQRRIVAVVEESTAVIDAAIEGLQSEVSLFQEYRTRLITDTVTGKLDVREAAAKLSNRADEAMVFENLPNDLDLHQLEDDEFPAEDDLDAIA